VPGWFQPVLALYDAKGKELAFADDYRFKPDPVILFQVPADGDYVFAIYDSIYRGREDFIYRITVGELPFATSVFPLGGQIGAALPPDLNGWNLRPEDLATRLTGAKPGVQTLAASRMGYDSNRLPFAWDTLPDAFDREPNNSVAAAQAVTLPVVINGRIQQTDDWDVYSFTGKANQTLVAEVQARRLDSPLDSVIKLTDVAGKVIAFNDDREDLTAGVNTHPADSFFTAKLPSDGTYFVHIGETARKGGEEYGYRLRLSAPQPDFELRLSPSSVSVAINGTASVSVQVVRKEGFAGPIKLALGQPVAGFTAVPVTIPANQTTARLTVKSSATPTAKPVVLPVVGTAKINDRDVVREAVATEDRMQAFLWRHLVPANDLQVVSYDARVKPAPKRIVPTIPPLPAVAPVATAGSRGARPNPNSRSSKSSAVSANSSSSTKKASSPTASTSKRSPSARRPPDFATHPRRAARRQPAVGSRFVPVCKRARLAFSAALVVDPPTCSRHGRRVQKSPAPYPTAVPTAVPRPPTRRQSRRPYLRRAHRRCRHRRPRSRSGRSARPRTPTAKSVSRAPRQPTFSRLSGPLPNRPRVRVPR
jgi:hypothetical protein